MSDLTKRIEEIARALNPGPPDWVIAFETKAPRGLIRYDVQIGVDHLHLSVDRPTAFDALRESMYLKNRSNRDECVNRLLAAAETALELSIKIN